MLEGFRTGTVLGRVGRPEEVVEGYFYSMKDAFSKGAVVTSDGGRLLK